MLARKTIDSLRAERCQHCNHFKEDHYPSSGCRYPCPCRAEHKAWRDELQAAIDKSADS